MINLESRITLPNQDDLDNFAQEFKNKIILENELKNKKNYTEIILENNKQTSFYYQGEEYILLIIAYSNSNFVILSKNKKIGNIYSADLEDSEFPDDEESIDLPPQYETKCILGNRLDLLNNFLSNFIAANIFFIFNKMIKIEKFKLFGLNDLTNKDITSDCCSKNENSFLIKTIKNYSNYDCNEQGNR